MKLKKTDFIAIAVLVAALVHLVVVYPALPDKVVTNWGFDGDVTYGHKSTLWMMYGISAAMFPLFFVIPKIDPKGRNYQKMEGFYSMFRLIIVLFLTGMLELVIFSADDANRFNIAKIAMIALSFLMIFIGNYLPKCKHNYTFGIKTMWTYADERVWNDTHRFGGIIFVIAGVVMLVSSLLFGEKVMFAVTMVAVIGAVTVTTVYSYLSFRKYNH